MKLSLYILFLFIGISCTSKPKVEPNGCADYLELWNKKPDKLKFVACKPSTSAQLKTLKSEYIASGKDAKEVEQALVRNFKMKPLIFQCCGWMTNENGHYLIEERPYDYEIFMFSEETLEKNWDQIKYFKVIVEKYLEEP